jgi:peptide/nickel transport system ATP-binding protein
VDYLPPERLYREASPGHVVQVWGEEWDHPMLAKDLQGALLG